jgi:hypothetical protein
MHHFVVTGVYDGLFVMRDIETSTLWNHITGEAVHGPLRGRTLPVSNLMQTNVKQALLLDANTKVAISSRPFSGAGPRLGTNENLNSKFTGTLGTEDTRRPRMDLGLGVWSEKTRRYYSRESIRKRGDAFIDSLDGKKVLIYIDPESSVPAALFVNSNMARVHGKEIRLDNGMILRSGLLIGGDGRPQSVERPQQIFTRWYGFALTFPGCEVFND